MELGSRIEERWGRLSLFQQFLLGTFLVVVASGLAIGWWVVRQIEDGVVHRTAGATALYVESFLSPQFQSLGENPQLTASQLATLDGLLKDTSLGQEIVALKIWGPGGKVLYSTTPSNIGQLFPAREKGRRAWRGEIVAGISDLQEEENVGERAANEELLEYYIPVRQEGTGRIVAVAEFYQEVDQLRAEATAAGLRSWLVVALSSMAAYLLLVGIVRRGSLTIARQQAELSSKVEQLTALLAQNDELHERVRRAATRTTTLNEQFLRRVSAEIHDGPAQDLGLALLRLDSARTQLAECSPTCPLHQGGEHEEELETVQFSMNRALQELRSIASGLRLPELERLTMGEVITRAVAAHERRTASKVEAQLEGELGEAALPAKITAYRVVQEALSNAYRHGGGAGQQVRASEDRRQVRVEVSDSGPGFVWTGAPADTGHLGLVGMRERVESQGGVFIVDTLPGRGTRLTASIPLYPPDPTTE